VRAARGPGSESLFQADLAALATVAGVGGFLLRAVSALPVRIGVGALAAGLAHLLLSGSPGGGAALALLVLAVGAAAGGLAALGRRGGCPPFAAGTIGAVVLWVAMTGLFWADPVAQLLPRAARRPLVEAVLHVDPATAAAYSAAGFDRLREPRIYAEVPLASTMTATPRATTTALGWIGVAGLAWALASIRPRRGPGVP
jgi:hypothetical protein